MLDSANELFAAALFGSCFPTTIYIGHPGWKAVGGRVGYSLATGIALGPAVGTLVGGLILGSLGWRWIFGATAVLGTMVGAWVLPDGPGTITVAGMPATGIVRFFDGGSAIGSGASALPTRSAPRSYVPRSKPPPAAHWASWV